MVDLVLADDGAPDEDDILQLVSLSQLKDNERIYHNQQNDLLTRQIKAAYGYLDGPRGWLNRAVLTQSWIMYCPKFEDILEIPLPPLIEVTALKYIDTDGVEQTAATSLYEVTTENGVGQIRRIADQSWPSTKSLQRAVIVEFTARIGDAAEIAISDKVKLQQAIIMLASHFYRSPSATFGEPRTVNVNRVTEFGLKELVGFLRIPPSHT